MENVMNGKRYERKMFWTENIRNGKNVINEKRYERKTLWMENVLTENVMNGKTLWMENIMNGKHY